MKQKISLNGKWNCTGYSPNGEKISVEGVVPGTVHKDLIAAGIVKDLYSRDNTQQYRWIECWKWVYDRTFVLHDVDENMQICFEGLDVYCDISINGNLLGHTDNMHIPHQFPVGNLLRIGENSISVTFYPTEEQVKDYPERDGVFTWKRLYIRRIQATHGWDSAERLITFGIIRSVYLYTDSSTEIDNIYVYTDNVDKYSAQIRLNTYFKTADNDSWLHTVITAPNGTTVYEDKKLIVEREMYKFIDITSPLLWYPNGYGEQPLYHIRTEVLKADKCISEKELYFGIRTLKILQKKDIEGSEYYNKCLAIQKAVSPFEDIANYERNTEFYGFVVLVNDTPIMCKGANWIPCEAYQFEGNDRKITTYLQLSQKAGINMIRIWGGGVFEEDIFYEECDRRGILVQQDFLMACGDYPCEEEWFLKHLEKEAEYAVLRLRNHSCLAWWNGDNENGAEGSDNVKDYRGRKGVVGTIMPILYRYDHQRHLFPSSPTGGELYTSLTSGTTHNTMFEAFRYYDIRTRNMDDYEEYQDMYLSRFNCEEPLAGAPSLTSLRKFMTEEDIFGKDVSIWQYHTKNHPSHVFFEYDLFRHLEIMAGKILGDFKNSDDRIFKIQYLQYDFVRKSMELYRRNKWFSSGILYWMLNDMWPASGWSLIDYYCIPKAGYYAFAESAKPVIVSVKHELGEYRIYVCNDSLDSAKGVIKIQAENFNDKSYIWNCEFEAEANQSSVVMCIPEEEIQKHTDSSSVLICRLQSNLGEHITRYYITRPANVNYPKAEIRILKQTSKEITLITDKFIPAVRLEGECIFEDNFFVLMPNEEKTVKFESVLSENELPVDIEITILQ